MRKSSRPDLLYLQLAVLKDIIGYEDNFHRPRHVTETSCWESTTGDKQKFDHCGKQDTGLHQHLLWSREAPLPKSEFQQSRLFIPVQDQLNLPTHTHTHTPASCNYWRHGNNAALLCTLEKEKQPFIISKVIWVSFRRLQEGPGFEKLED